MDPQTPIIALTTVATQADAQTLAQKIIEQKLATCVQIDGPIQSFYHWQNQLCQESEYRLTCKSTKAQQSQLQKYVLQAHPYDMPQWLCLEATASKNYQQWLIDNTS